MSRANVKKSSRIWLDRQNKDPFVKKSKKEGYRSRAAYKLLEIQERSKILKPGIVVVELGAAPGSWSQVIMDIIAPYGKLIAVDILPIELIKSVDIIKGDFTDPVVVEQICNLAKGRVDLILSDVAPNLSGIWSVDIPKAMYLAEMVIEVTKKLLKKNGNLLIKLFQGEGFEKYLALLRRYFAKVIIYKPKSSRVESREIYVLAKGYYE